jgi:hypothetical protein
MRRLRFPSKRSTRAGAQAARRHIPQLRVRTQRCPETHVCPRGHAFLHPTMRQLVAAFPGLSGWVCVETVPASLHPLPHEPRGHSPARRTATACSAPPPAADARGVHVCAFCHRRHAPAHAADAHGVTRGIRQLPSSRCREPARPHLPSPFNALQTPVCQCPYNYFLLLFPSYKFRKLIFEICTTSNVQNQKTPSRIFYFLREFLRESKFPVQRCQTPAA